MRLSKEIDLKTLHIVVALAAAALAVATDASAQYPGGQPPRRGGATAPTRPQDARPPAFGDSPASLRSRVQYALDRLEDELRITVAQQSAWDAFAARVVRFADDVARERFATRDAPATDATALQQFDRIAQTAHEHATAVRDVADAGRALYAALAPEQQRVADRRLAALVRALASGAPIALDARPPVDGAPADAPKVR